MQSSETNRRVRLEVRGIVQGVGFRPFVFSLARQLGLAGSVRNHSAGVTIEAEGERWRISNFVDRLQTKPPRLAQIDSIDVIDIPMEGHRDFHIIESESAAGIGTPVSPDVATCADCLSELRDSGDRRYRYPFTNCTNCGPRYTIVRDIPYDRPLTTMSKFAMCDACDREYRDASDRRYHAQPNACPVCGPTVWFVQGASTNERAAFTRISVPVAQHAIDAFHRSIDADEVVAVKGIGGFHLACAAQSSPAVHKLRVRKGRVDKPLAVMVADVAAARRFVHISASEERLLSGHQRPIVLLRRRSGSNLSELVAPGTDFIGVMLAYSPLHALLVERRSLVMTSGNVSEEPIVRTNLGAFKRLRSLADAFLLHDRDIHVVCDDSVVRAVHGRELPIRRSRGYAPMPVRLNTNVPAVLAVGGELKATFCLTKDRYALMSPHIGDMGNLETLEAFQRTVDHFQRLFRIKPARIACDMHPSYLSSQWARKRAQENDLPLIEVQHHHAHIASVLAEHHVDPARPVIGISFDGTGYGPDGAIWGGEILVASCSGYRRWAHLKYVPLPGGDASIRRPYRSALAHLWAAGLPWDERLPCVAECPESERAILYRQLQRDLNCTQTSSMGRLFDAVAALIGIRQTVNYEAQAAMEMEALSDELDGTCSYTFELSEGQPRVIDSVSMLEEISKDVIASVPRSRIVSRFHCSIASMIVEACERLRDQEGLDEVVLSGGVFQNALLLQHSVDRLKRLGFDVMVHRVVPPNDGGLALGQAIIAASTLGP